MVSTQIPTLLGGGRKAEQVYAEAKKIIQPKVAVLLRKDPFGYSKTSI